jgi:hypothetical protein
MMAVNKKIPSTYPKETSMELIGGPFDGLSVLPPIAIIETIRVPISHPIKVNGKPARGPIAGYAFYEFMKIDYSKPNPRAIYAFMDTRAKDDV